MPDPPEPLTVCTAHPFWTAIVRQDVYQIGWPLRALEWLLVGHARSLGAGALIGVGAAASSGCARLGYDLIPPIGSADAGSPGGAGPVPDAGESAGSGGSLGDATQDADRAPATDSGPTLEPLDGGTADASPVPEPRCDDGLRNGDEVAVDCGGVRCGPCLCSFASPRLLGKPNAPGLDLWAPSLSSDGLTLYVSLTAPGFGERVARSTRPSLDAPFGAASALPSPVNGFDEGTPALSQDGLALYFFSTRAGAPGAASSRDVYVATRASVANEFGGVAPVASVNSPDRDDRPWLSPDELDLYFTSQRASVADDLWRATRSSKSAAFGAAVAITELNSTGNDAGLVLTADGLVAYFSSDRVGGAGGVDIYRASRQDASSAFSAPEPVEVLNSVADDFDPALTSDGRELYFASTRGSDDYRLWRSSISCP